MNWKDILKMPMPVGTRQQRDENFKQQIIDYEKRIIEPALTEFFSSNEATNFDKFSIVAASGSKDSGKSGLKMNHGYNAAKPAFVIGEEDVERLGNNHKFIIDTISNLYSQEGYNVQRDYNNVITLQEKQQGE